MGLETADKSEAPATLVTRDSLQSKPGPASLVTISHMSAWKALVLGCPYEE